MKLEFDVTQELIDRAQNGMEENPVALAVRPHFPCQRVSIWWSVVYVWNEGRIEQSANVPPHVTEFLQQFRSGESNVRPIRFTAEFVRQE